MSWKFRQNWQANKRFFQGWIKSTFVLWGRFSSKFFTDLKLFDLKTQVYGSLFKSFLLKCVDKSLVFWNVNQTKNSFQPRGCRGWPMIKNVACQLMTDKKRSEPIWRSKIWGTKILFYVKRALYEYTKICLNMIFLYIHPKASKYPLIAVPIIMNNPVIQTSHSTRIKSKSNIY